MTTDAPAPVAKPRPSWALAWILQDWRRGALRRAYKLASADDDFDDLRRPPSPEVIEAVKTARDRLASYTRALDCVLDEWREDGGS